MSRLVHPGRSSRMTRAGSWLAGTVRISLGLGISRTTLAGSAAGFLVRGMGTWCCRRGAVPSFEPDRREGPTLWSSTSESDRDWPAGRPYCLEPPSGAAPDYAALTGGLLDAGRRGGYSSVRSAPANVLTPMIRGHGVAVRTKQSEVTVDVVVAITVDMMHF